MIKYPIFEFYAGRDPHFYQWPTRSSWAELESDDLDNLGTLIDSEGRILKARDIGDVSIDIDDPGREFGDFIEIYDPGSEPNLDRLRGALTDFIVSKFHDVPSYASIEDLVLMAHEIEGEQSFIKRLRRLFRLDPPLQHDKGSSR